MQSNLKLRMTSNQITKKRIFIFKKVKNFSKHNKDIKSVLEYPCTWFMNSGYYKLKSYYEPVKTRFFVQYLKELFLISTIPNYKFYESKKQNLKNKKTLVISWFTPKDFDKKYNFKDKYLQYTKSHSDLLFLINVGNYFETKKLKKVNFVILQKKDSFFNFLYLVKSILKTILNGKQKISCISSYSIFSEIVTYKVLKILKNNNFEKIIIPYEAQPFQKLLISKIRKKFKNIKIVSYINGIQPFPIHLFDNKNIPDLNLSISKTQIFQLTKIFKWDRNKLKLIKSNKFSKKKLINFKNKIVLPYQIQESEKVLRNISLLFEHKPKNFFSKFYIAPHPIGKNNLKYMKFVNSLKSVVKKYNYKFNKKKTNNKSIIIGSTSSIFDSLELNLETYHIVNDPILQTLDNYFWPTIDIVRFNENIFIYTTKIKKKLINY